MHRRLQQAAISDERQGLCKSITGFRRGSYAAGRRDPATHDQSSQMRDSKALLGWLALDGAPTH